MGVHHEIILLSEYIRYMTPQGNKLLLTIQEFNHSHFLQHHND